jgi:hypothetical protein
MLFLTEKQTDEVWEPSKSNVLSETGKDCIEK